MKCVNMGKAVLVAALVFAGFAANAVTVLTTFESPELFGTPAPLGSSQSMSSAAFTSWMTTGGVPGWTSNGSVGFGEVGSGSVGNLGKQFLFLSSSDIATYTFTGLTSGVQYSLAFSFDYSGAAGFDSQGLTVAGSFAVKDGSNFVVAATNLAKDTPFGSSINTYFGNLGQATSQNLSFTAVGTSLAFIFATTSGANDHLAIDNVSVAINALPIPEPGTYAMFLAGLGAVAFVASRRGPRAS